ncbi:unnamed protein product [Phytophthora lilii]|uniref:Unnamed protein product n=1 Tax=Phytophthora lilii TaxID=2077276 RepID=A0A9W6X199_9STRA|nr:unnamed protein product [Phytophthora lilii]
MRGVREARTRRLSPESLCTLETEKGSGGLLVVYASVRGYSNPFRVLIDAGASKAFARRQTVARNGDKFANTLLVPRMVEMTEESEVVVDTSGVANTASHDASEARNAPLREASHVDNMEPRDGIRHEIDLVSGTKYCVIRQWLLPREQCEVIDAFFAANAKAGGAGGEIPALDANLLRSEAEREVASGSRLQQAEQCDGAGTDTDPTEGRVVKQHGRLHAVQRAGFSRRILPDPHEGESYPSYGSEHPKRDALGLVGDATRLSNAQRRLIAWSHNCFDLCVRSRRRTLTTSSSIAVPRKERRLSRCIWSTSVECWRMRANKLYANIDKCAFAVEEINVLGCFVSSARVRGDPDKVKAIAAWPTPGPKRTFGSCRAELPCPRQGAPGYEVWAREVPSASSGLKALRDLHGPRVLAEYHELAASVAADGTMAVILRGFDILLEAHDAPIGGHLCREKTFLAISETFRWAHMYKWVSNYVKTCETCQRVKPAGHASASLQSLPVPSDCWKSMSLDFVFGLPADDRCNTGILVFVCRLSKMVHLAPVPETVRGEQAARLFLENVFRYHGLPETIVSDRDPRFTATFWQTLFRLLEPWLTMSTADHSQTDGQTERVNRVLEDTLRSVCAEMPHAWAERLPMVGFAHNNAVHASTGFTPFYLNGLQVRPTSLRKQLSTFIDNRLCVISRVRHAMANAQDKLKEYSDCHGRGNLNVFYGGTYPYSTLGTYHSNTVSSVGSNKLKHRFIGPFTVLGKSTYLSQRRPTRYHDSQGQNPVAEAEGSHEEERLGFRRRALLRLGRLGPYDWEYHTAAAPDVSVEPGGLREDGEPPDRGSQRLTPARDGQHDYGGLAPRGADPQSGGEDPPGRRACPSERQPGRQGQGRAQSQERTHARGEDGSPPVATQRVVLEAPTRASEQQPSTTTARKTSEADTGAS